MTTMTTKKKTAKKYAAKKYAILANDRYGLYAGQVESYDPVTRVAHVSDCRHVAQWYGRTGGITSLAAHGICGMRASESRIGAASTTSILTGIVNIFECSADARASIEAAGQA